MNPEASTEETLRALLVGATSPWFTRQSAAKYLQVSERMVDKLVAAGALTTRGRAGNSPRFHRDDLDHAIEVKETS